MNTYLHSDGFEYKQDGAFYVRRKGVEAFRWIDTTLIPEGVKKIFALQDRRQKYLATIDSYEEAIERLEEEIEEAQRTVLPDFEGMRNGTILQFQVQYLARLTQSTRSKEYFFAALKVNSLWYLTGASTSRTSEEFATWLRADKESYGFFVASEWEPAV